MHKKIYKLENWKVKGFYPYVPLLGKSLETGEELKGITEWIPAKVPGCEQYDLWKSGWVENPYFGMNSLKCEWVENRWWMYKTNFDYKISHKCRLNLHFEGLDYKARIYFNNIFLGEHEGMFIPVEFDITKLVKAKGNEIIVLFENTPQEMSQIGYTSDVKTQKSRFSYKWDFSTHLVPIGIWKEAYIKETGDNMIDEVQIQSDIEDNHGLINVKSIVRNLITKQNGYQDSIDCFVEVAKNDLVIESKKSKISFWNNGYINSTVNIEIENPDIWYPNGYGEQPLYNITLKLMENGKVSDMWEGRTGFRSLKWEKNLGAKEDAFPYTMNVNEKKVYIKGVNLTPLDVMYGTVTKTHYKNIINLMKKANINFVRIWGGGIIEKDYFYRLCDESGILIWQEFIQSGSGIQSSPSENKQYLKLLKETATSAIKSRRNHISLACWCGGNELMNDNQKPLGLENKSLQLLKELVDKYDSKRIFVPTSGYGPSEFLDVEKPGNNHDVHGPWKYGGDEEHYRIFNTSDSMLHSEFGADGFCLPQSMKNFLSKKDIDIYDMESNPAWRHHGEWWCTIERDKELFGSFESLESFTKASQWTQAEAIRYAVESNRRRKYQNSGSLVWQFNETWPNVSSTSLVDYYGQPKMAYYWLRKAYEPIHLSLKYEKLFYEEGDSFKAEFYVNNSLEGLKICCNIACMDIDGKIILGKEITLTLQENSCLKIWEFDIKVDDVFPDIFIVKLKSVTENDRSKCENVYIFGRKDRENFKNLLLRKRPKLEWEIVEKTQEKTGEMRNVKYEVFNRGGSVALYVRMSSNKLMPYVISPQNYSTIKPGESTIYEVIYLDENVGLDDIEKNIFFSSW